MKTTRAHATFISLALTFLLVSLRVNAAEPRATYTRNVAIVLYDGVELLDFAGPGEVFDAAGMFGAIDGARAFRVYTVAASHEPLTSQRFLKVTPEFSFAEAPLPDIVVIPGGNSRRLLESADGMAWVKKTTSQAEITMTVCTGAFVLAKTGVMSGHDVTTHFGALDGLRRAVPDARVQAGRRYVDNGSFLTTAGVSAGIDGALHLVARLLGRGVADRTARYMEYQWAPEATLAGTYSTFNPSTDERGRALQLASLHADEHRPEEAAKILRALVAKDAHDAAAWYQLGSIASGSGNFTEAATAFRGATEKPSLRANAFYNLACVLARDGRKDDALEALRKAAENGFGPRVYAEGDADLESLRADRRFGETLALMDKKG
jgi:transcriptional regulator GlxA family with amidase domain